MKLNKNFLLTICLLIIFGSKSQSQDLLLTTKGDSLNVKILSKGQSHVQFIYKEKLRSTARELPLEQVTSIVPGFFVSPTKPELIDSNLSIRKGTMAASPDTIKYVNFDNELEIANLDTIKIISAFTPEIYFGINGGLSSRLFGTKLGITRDELAYVKQMKSGLDFGAETYFYFKRKWGVGLRSSYFLSTAANKIGDKDDVAIGLVAAGGVYRMPIVSGKQQVQIGFWLGYQAYNNDLVRDKTSLQLNSKSMAWGVTASLFQPIGKKLLLSLTGSCFLGTSVRMTSGKGVSKITSFLKQEDFEDLTRASLTLGLGFQSKIKNNK